MVAAMVQSGVVTRLFHSDLLNQDLQLFIKLPWFYERNDAVYPVLFCLDANRAFPLYATMSLIYETPPTKATEIILVGVGYQVDSDRLKGLAQWAAWRTRDLTTERRERIERNWEQRLGALGGEQISVQSGGASTFLACLQREVIPFVEANYRVSASNRGLAGYSYGGLFTLYALFQAPELFTRYFAGSPSMWESVFEYEEQYAQSHDDLKAKLFVSAGSCESDVLGPLQRMVDRLRSRGYPGLEMITSVFEGEDHSSAYAAAVSRALRVLYDQG